MTADDTGQDLGLCPECGAEMYVHADRCPACGSYVTPTSGRPGRRGWWLFVVVLILAAFLLVMLRF